MCKKIAPDFAHLFRTKLRLSALLHAIFTSLTPKRRKRKLQERILQLNKSRTYNKNRAVTATFVNNNIFFTCKTK